MRRTFVLGATLALLIAAPAQAESLILSQARAVARKVARKIAGYYGAETWRVKGCYKTSRSRGRCVIRFYGFQHQDRDCTFVINVRAKDHVTYSSYYADDCTP